MTIVKITQGDKFNKLTIIKEIDSSFDKNNKRIRNLLCRCECGKGTIVSLSNIRAGHTTSCGCNNLKRIVKHGCYKTKEYRLWSGIIQRCLNKNNKRYADYGGRGIKVCDRWLDFNGFYEDMGNRPIGMTLDRINNSKGYFKENCRWANKEQQMNNTRRNHFLEYQGENKTIAQWAKKIGVNYSSLFARIRRGWSTEKALGIVKRRI